ncbi:MAG: hypothetical protein R2793_08265 [Flavobacteriaceae bacterium]
MTTTNKPSVLFWIVAVIALLWNAMGVKAYLDQAFRTETFLNTYTAEQLALVDSQPAWVTAAFAVAVWFALLGAIALLLRKKWAKPLFLISLIGIVVQMSNAFFMNGGTDNFGPGGVAMALSIIIFGIFIYWFSGYAAKKGWIK